MRFRVVSLLLLLALPGHGAFASECTEIMRLEDHAESPVNRDGVTCTLFMSETGTTGTSCHWTFPFRDQAALFFADTLWRSLTLCRPGKVLGADQPVNHPDSYELREWAAPSGVYAISVKDKGALDQTLVFFRLVPTAEQN